MNAIQIISVMERFEFKCALTESKDYHIEHWLPQVRGGETSVENCYPLDATLNLRKGKQNPFEFFEREDIRQHYDVERFNRLVFWLAFNNDMTVVEFRSFTLWAYENENPNISDWKRGNFE